MAAIPILIEEFPGEAAWQRFVDVFRSGWIEVADKPAWLAATGDEEIAIVLSVSMGEKALTWLDRPVGALDKLAPQTVLDTVPAGVTAVKSLLMRMPL